MNITKDLAEHVSHATVLPRAVHSSVLFGVAMVRACC